MLVSDWTNPFNHRDSSDDGVVSPLDVLLGINELEQRTTIDALGALPPRVADSVKPFWDVNGDSFLSPLDVLIDINDIEDDLTSPTITAALANDTAPRDATNMDGLTFDPLIVGTVADDITGVQFFKVQIDGQPEQDVEFQRDGDFSFDPGFATDGSDDDEHLLVFTAMDARGLESVAFTVNLTLDTQPPAAATAARLSAAADTGLSDSDGVTKDNTPTFSGDGELGSIVSLMANGQLLGEVAVNSPWEITSEALPDGGYDVSVVTSDPAGNTASTQSMVQVAIDTDAPTASSNLQGTLTRSFAFFVVNFDDPLPLSFFDATNYELQIKGGPNDGRVLEIVRVTSTDGKQALGELREPLADQDYELTLKPTLSDLAGNALTGTTLFPFTMADPPGIGSISPADGEELVNVTRETIVRFDEPVDPATVDSDSLLVIAHGERIPGRVVVSSTERFATFFYDTSLPASTEVRVVVDGSQILGRDGRLLDADADDQPGGTLMADFRTSPLTRIPGTELFGYLYDPIHLQPQESAPIAVPSGDPQFDPQSTGTKTILFKRAEFDPGTGTDAGNPRRFLNHVTSFIDASMVYGSDELRARALRTLDGTGRLKTSAGDHLPINNAETFPGGPLTNNNEGPFPAASLPVAGDVRAAQVPTLSALQTLWVREHNRYAAEVKSAHSRWTEDQIYEAARRWVGALIQQITYQEFLPAIPGANPLPAYAGYDPDVDPNISALFSTAAFRVGHTVQSSSIQRLDADGQSLPGGPLVIRNAFFNPNPLRDDGLDAYLRGMVAGTAQEVDLQVIDDLRNFLFGPPGAGGLDLVSLNIQRGRDMGLPSYNQAREDVGLARVTSFSEITSNATAAAALQTIYGDVDMVDVWIGGLAEDHVAGAAVGPLFAAIIQDQFVRSRDGDRFWYENDQFSDADLTAIRATKLSEVMTRNSGVTGLPANVFTTIAANTGPGAGGTTGTPTETRSIDGYGNNETDEHLGEAKWPLRTDYTVSFGDGISSLGGTDRPNPRAISNAVAAQTGNTVSAVGLTDMASAWGQFLDHDMDLTPSQSAAGTNIPIVGATIRVDGLPDLTAVTDAQGFFEFEDLPAPEFFARIDATTVTNAPPDTTYASVGRSFHTVPGRRQQTNLNGVPFNMYLPPTTSIDIVALSNSEATDVGFGAEGMAELERRFPAVDPSAWSQVKVTFAPDAAVDSQGNAATQAAIIPVPPNRLPAPLPPGVDPKLVISIQAPGATNFDIPAPVSFPNLEGLQPGEQSLLWSYDHDAGAWKVVGTGTVSDDGLAIASDPGVGIRAPGWHFTNPGTVAEARPPKPPKPVCDVPMRPALSSANGLGAGSVDIFKRTAAGKEPLRDHLFVKDKDSFRLGFTNLLPLPTAEEEECGHENEVLVIIRAQGAAPFLKPIDRFVILTPLETRTISIAVTDLLWNVYSAVENVLYGARFVIEVRTGAPSH